MSLKRDRRILAIGFFAILGLRGVLVAFSIANLHGTFDLVLDVGTFALTILWIGLLVRTYLRSRRAKPDVPPEEHP
jgi:hypothetical protein